jgi:hypothetical protein
MVANHFNALAAVSAFAAAILWLVSATAHVKSRDEVGSEGWTDPMLDSNGSDVLASAKLQQKWSRRGALAAAFAAILQGVALAFSVDVG